MADQRVVVDPQTGNVLILHRRSIGLGTTAFLMALVSLITARNVEREDLKEAFFSFGLLCCIFLVILLIWRCCCCCCHPKNRSPGYVVVGGAQTSLGPGTIIQQRPVNATVLNPGYPVAPAVQPVLASYPTPGVGTFGAPPFVAGAQPQPAYNPNMPPHILQPAVLQPNNGGNEATAPQADAPPSYSEATGMPLKQ